MARHRNAEWCLKEQITDYSGASLAVLMDIRDELKSLNSILQCPNFQAIPHKLDVILRNTAKPRRKKGE
jgi:hypothetical protein